MKYIICCVENYDANKKLQIELEKIDKLDYCQIHLFTDCAYNKIMPYDILHSFDVLKNKFCQEDEFIFVSTIKNLFNCVYRLYHQNFDKFIFFEDEEIKDYKLDDIFNIISELEVSDKDLLYKDIYYDFNVIEQDNIIKKEIVQKYYYIDNSYYLFEPTMSDEISIIGKEENIIDNTKLINYIYFYDVDFIDKILFQIENMDKNNTIQMNDMYTLEENIDKYTLLEKAVIIKVLENYSLNKNLIVQKRIFLNSFLVYLNNNGKYILEIQDIILNELKKYTYCSYFLWNQIKRLSLLNNFNNSDKISKNQQLIYKQILDEYKEKFKNELIPINKNERDKNLIVVFTIQFLEEKHAPTRTTLERVYTLGKLLEKKVVLINTREQYTNIGEIPFYKLKSGNIKREFNNKGTMSYNDFEFGFYQAKTSMPQLNEIFNILKFIKEKKPYFIMSIGTGSITADLCGMIVPQISLALAFSSLPISSATFLAIGKNLNDSEWKELIKRGYEKESIIETRFTFDLNKQKEKFKKEKLNIPENKFILVVVGIRLDSEIKEDFIEFLEKTFNYNVHVVFAGIFNNYYKICSKHLQLKKHSTYIYMCDDMLALMELCDLYINPKRLGGGFSVIEAFSKGVPAVTINTGDVAVAAGEEFCVGDYDEMLEMVKRYIKDKEFYSKMSKKAKERAELMTDSKSAMEEIIDKVENSPIFW